MAVTLGRAELPEEDFPQDWTAELPDWVVDAIRLDVSMHPRKARSPSRLLEGIAWEVTTAACRAKVPLADLVYKSDTREVGIGNGQYRKAEPGEEIGVLIYMLWKEHTRQSRLRAERREKRKQKIKPEDPGR